MNPTADDLRKAIHAAMSERGLTRHQVAMRSGLTTTRAYAAMNCRRPLPTFDALAALAGAVGIRLTITHEPVTLPPPGGHDERDRSLPA